MLFDPLDGSGNIDANITIGSIFSIYRRVTPSGPGTLQDVLQPGHRQVAAGYALFGSSMMFVYSTGHGVHGFTMDPTVGEFLLSHENIRIPRKGAIYSTNEGNAGRWMPGMRKYVEYLKQEDKGTGRPYSSRYVGSLVADVHRTLLYGGIYFYPGDSKNDKGKLRLMYENNPLAYIVEQAGGAASDGVRRMLDVVPDCPRAISDQFGSKQQVERALMKKGRKIELVQRHKAESDLAEYSLGGYSGYLGMLRQVDGFRARRGLAGDDKIVVLLQQAVHPP